MKIAIRVDASRAIGIGHLSRCASLGAALREVRCDTRFVCRDLGLPAAADNSMIVLPPPASDPPHDSVPHAAWAGVGWRQDADETIAALRHDPPHWVVVDHYSFDARWHREVARALDCHIAVIDDLADRALDATFVIDHNYCVDHGAKYAGLVVAGARIMGGPQFALLSSAYAAAPRHTVTESVRSIGIFMGGVDAAHASAAALNAVNATGFAGPVEVATTSANPNLARLRDLAAHRPETVLSVDLPDLSAFFARHDLQIGAGGGATWERSCIGAPTVAVVIADNQRASIPALAATGAVAAATLDTLAETLADVMADPARRRAMADAARKLVDGRGAQRVALALAAQTLTLRPANSDDARNAFEWRNDPATRAVSRNPAALDWDAHLNWFAQTLADPDRRLFVGMVGAIPVGIVRLDARGDTAEVSLYLDPDLHGLGLGGPLLRAAEGFAPAVLVATVLEGNETSARLFAATGYSETTPGHWRKELRR